MRGGRRGSPRAGARGGSPTPTPAPRSPRAMKSARGRHRTRLAGGPATSRCGCSAEVTQQRAGHRRGQLSGRAFPRGRRAALQSAPGLSEVEPNSGVGRALSSLLPRDQLRLGIFLLPTSQGSSSALGSMPLPPHPLRSASGGHRSARGSRPERPWIAPARRLCSSETSLEALLGPECRGQAGEPGSQAGGRSLGTRPSALCWEARGVPPRSPPSCPPGAEGCFSGSGFAEAGRSQLLPSRCYRSRRRG